MEIKIIPCKNGAYAVFDDGENETKTAYRFEEDNPSGLQELLYDIKELFLPGSKYDQLRVHIVLKHGTDYGCTGCDICGIKKGSI
jgi:hypothetical protein